MMQDLKDIGNRIVDLDHRIVQWCAWRLRNKLENVQHKKSVTDGHRRHVLESHV